MDGTHLSDFDPYDNENDADPISVSISVVALKTVAPGEEVLINDDEALNPDDDTLDAWLAIGDSLQIFVMLREGKRGIAMLSDGVVQERLSVGSHAVDTSKIVVSWEAEHWRLSLQGSSSATRADFQAALEALQLQTVHFRAGKHSDDFAATGYFRGCSQEGILCT